jgi:predicted DNA-binding transcriptional regulator AlpA
MSEQKPDSGAASKVYNIRQFCEHNDISRSYIYLLWKRGDGPKYIDLGGRRKITIQQEAEWRQRMEVKSN